MDLAQISILFVIPFCVHINLGFFFSYSTLLWFQDVVIVVVVFSVIIIIAILVVVVTITDVMVNMLTILALSSLILLFPLQIIITYIDNFIIVPIICSIILLM